MLKATPDELKKLAKYSKEEIIKALGDQIGSDHIVSGMLCDLKYMRDIKAIEAERKASDAALDASIAMFKWRAEMATKYGDGKSVRISDIPQEDIARGAALERTFEKATKLAKRLEAKLHKTLAEE